MSDFNFIDFFNPTELLAKKIIEKIQENKDKPIVITINGNWVLGKSIFGKIR